MLLFFLGRCKITCSFYSNILLKLYGLNTAVSEALNGGCEITAWNRLHCHWTGCKRHVYSFSLQKNNWVKMNAGPRASRHPNILLGHAEPTWYTYLLILWEWCYCSTNHWLVTQRLLFSSAVFLLAAECVVKLNIFQLSLWLYVLFLSCISDFPFWDRCV